MRSLVLVLALLAAVPAAAEIYRYVDANGTVRFQDHPPVTGRAETVAPSDPYIGSFRIPEPAPASAGEVLEEVRRRPAAWPRVEMYSTAWCGYCKRARAYLRERGIPFTEYDVEQDRAAARRAKRLGATGVPLIVVGEQVLKGFDRGALERLLPRAGER